MKKRFVCQVDNFGHYPMTYASDLMKLNLSTTNMTKAEAEEFRRNSAFGRATVTVEWDPDSSRIHQLRSQIESYNANILTETSRVNEGHERICRIQQEVRTLERELADLERQS